MCSVYEYVRCAVVYTSRLTRTVALSDKHKEMTGERHSAYSLNNCSSAVLKTHVELQQLTADDSCMCSDLVAFRIPVLVPEYGKPRGATPSGSYVVRVMMSDHPIATW